MGVKLQFVLGVILVSLACASKDTSSEVPTSSTTLDNVALDKPERHINLIENSPKTETELKNVNTQKNLTSIKLNKTEPQIELPTPKEDDNEKVESLSNNVVEKDNVDNKENAIKKDLTDKSKDDRSRAIDTSPQKNIPSDFLRKNNAFTSTFSTDSEKYLNQLFGAKTTTMRFDDFDDIELTTPKTYFFDDKFKSAVDSIEQKLGDEVDEMDNSEEDHQVERLTKNYDTTPSSNFMEFKEVQGMKNNTFKDKNSFHKDMVVMQVKRVNINTSFQDTIYDDEDEDDDKHIRGESEKIKTTTPKNNFIMTTRKSVTFTKPSAMKNNSYILSNNIETETFKAVNFVTSEAPTTRATREDDERSSHSSEEISITPTTEKIQDNQIIPLQAATGTTSDKVSTTTIEHNLIPATESDEETTTSSEENFKTRKVIEEFSRTVKIEENLTPTITFSEDVREITTTFDDSSEEDTTDSEPPTTNMIETTVAHTTDDSTTWKTPDEPTTSFERKSEPLIEEILTLNDEPTTLRDRSSTVYDEPTTMYESEEEQTTVDTERPVVPTTDTQKFFTSNEDNEKTIERSFEFTTAYRDEQESTEPDVRTEISVSTKEGTTMPSEEQESTTRADVYMTEPGFRTSKSMNLENINETSKLEGSTSSEVYENTFPAVTEFVERTTTTEAGPGTTDQPTTVADDTTSPTPKIIEIIPSDLGKVEVVVTTQRPIITTEVPTIVETTGDVFSTLRPRDAKILPESTESITVPTTTMPVPTVVPIVSETDHLTMPPEPVPTMVPIANETDHVTMPPELVTEETTEVRENYPSTTIRTTSTTVNLVRMVKIDENRTTLSPETLPPGDNDPEASTDFPAEFTKPSEDSIVITTTEEGPDTAATEGVTGPPEDKKGTIAAIVISTVGAVCLILLAGLLYIMRKRQKRFNYGERCRPVSLDDYSVDNVSVYNSVRRKGNYRQSKRSYGNPAFDDPTAVSHPLNFPALAKFANNVDDIKAEFEEIPQIAARTSELPEGCETKNRYANVIPLPETRVCLKPIEGYPNSDYINANYVTGPKNVKGYYIATQAPMQNTVDDFWRMVWEQQSKVILMITHFFENGVEKCVDYLPPSEVLDCHRLFGDFQVTLKKRDVKDKYIISSLQLKNMVSNSWREVTHFWYMGWPEKGVPSEANSLIAFLIEARSYMKSSTLDKNSTANGDMKDAPQNETNPVVVHCSPGTGRTGVVIACDIAIREFEQTRLVDIPKIVYRIRRDRANAVQTKEQYMFIYKVVSLYATKLTGGSLDSL